MDLSSLVRYDASAVTSGLDLRSVCAVYGIELDEGGMGFCPFHTNENSPAFSCFEGEDGKWRWKCHSGRCGLNGDVIDFIKRVEGLSYGDALGRCVELMDNGLPAPQPVVREIVDFTGTVSTAQEAAAAGVPVLEQLLAARMSPIELPWLLTEFRLGVDSRGAVLMPHYGRGASEPHAVKVRHADHAKTSLRGSRLTHLYGSHRDRARKDVVLVEGESDTWTVAWQFRDDPVDVLGLPRGVGSAVDPAWIDQLAGRRVTTLFDADEAGRRGAARWAAALLGKADSVRIGHLPESRDASSVPPDTILVALREASTVVAPSTIPVSGGGGCYWREPSAAAAEKGAGPTPITDWTVTVTGRIEVPGERIAYEVTLPNGRYARITDADLRDNSTMSRWANPKGLAWRGRGSDSQELLRLFEWQSVFVRRRLGVSTVGWHDGSFVLPEPVGTLGVPSCAHLPTEIDAKWGEKIALDKGSPQRDLPTLLTALHRPDVMTPVIGWVAAAPLRALCPQFPTLAVMGSAGSGKTTIVGQVLETFGFSNGTAITISNSTPHAVWATVGTTNMLPVWFDEYRYGAREDGLRALDQAIRDGWNGSATLRGGLGDNKSALTEMRATAPMVVSGESAFQETSHAERMVVVSLPPGSAGRDRSALEELLGARRAGFGREYLEWLLWAHENDMLEAPPALTDRLEQSLAVAAWGWRIFSLFAKRECGIDLPAFDGSLVAGEQQAMSGTPPIIEALREFHMAADRVSGAYVVWCVNDDVNVRYGRLPKLAASETTIVLPGNETAIRKWLEERFPGSYLCRGQGGRYLTLPNARAALFT